MANGNMLEQLLAIYDNLTSDPETDLEDILVIEQQLRDLGLEI